MSEFDGLLLFFSFLHVISGINALLLLVVVLVMLLMIPVSGAT